MPAFIDAHHHFWEPGGGRYPWMQAGARKFMGDVVPVCTPYVAADLARDAAALAGWRLAGSVHLQCGRDPADPAKETAWVQSLAGGAAWPIAIVAYANLADPRLDALLDAHAASPGFRGVRQMLNWHDSDERYRLCERGDLLRDPAWRRGYARLGERGLSFDLQVNPWQLHDAYEMARAHPGTALVVDHAGLPFGAPEARAAWRDGMRALASLEQVSVKFSGLGMVDRDWTPERIRPLFDELLALFGPGRMMFASNFPIDGLYRSYAQIWRCHDALARDLAPAQRDALFQATAGRVYRLPPSSSTTP